jgi:hypothetical protein
VRGVEEVFLHNESNVHSLSVQLHCIFTLYIFMQSSEASVWRFTYVYMLLILRKIMPKNAKFDSLRQTCWPIKLLKTWIVRHVLIENLPLDA